VLVSSGGDRRPLWDENLGEAPSLFGELVPLLEGEGVVRLDAEGKFWLSVPRNNGFPGVRSLCLLA